MAEFNNIYASLANFLQEFIVGLDYSVTFFDFDQFVTLDGLPLENILGMRGFDVRSGTTTMEVTVMFTVTTVDDSSMFIHRDILDKLFTVCQPTQVVPYLDADSGVKLGQFVVKAGTEILPVHRSPARTFQNMVVHLLGDRRPAL